MWMRVGAVAIAVLLGSEALADPAACLIEGGTFALSPGLTGSPASGPVKLNFSGTLSGPACGSHDGQTIRGSGTLMAGSSCAAAVGSGSISGVAGVTGFQTASAGPFPQVLLQNGAAPAGTMAVEFASNGPGTATQCSGAPGVTSASFNAAVVLGP